jgi:hypothetical protein
MQALSMQIQAGRGTPEEYIEVRKATILVGDSDRANFAQAITVPHGAYIVSTQ